MYLMIPLIILMIGAGWVLLELLSHPPLDKTMDQISGLSVIVPFKNEGYNLPILIQSIQQQEKTEGLDIELLFVNDHSNDEFRQHFKKLNNSFQLLDNVGHGKKQAIATGIAQTTHEYILTLDADVRLPENYFKNLQAYTDADLVILPVKMDGQDWFQRFAAIEFDYLQVLTFATAGMKRPSLCNGANLLFTKGLYNSTLEDRTDEQLVSGDDYFLLKAALRQKADIKAYNKVEMSVTTDAPSEWLALLNQRKRWISKTSWSATEVIGAIVMIFYAVVPVISFSLIAVNGWFALPLFFKFVAEFVLFVVLRKNYGWMLSLMIYQFLYPVYLVRMILHEIDDTKWQKSEQQEA